MDVYFVLIACFSFSRRIPLRTVSFKVIFLLLKLLRESRHRYLLNKFGLFKPFTRDYDSLQFFFFENIDPQVT
jgi:hypothetical protein